LVGDSPAGSALYRFLGRHKGQNHEDIQHQDSAEGGRQGVKGTAQDRLKCGLNALTQKHDEDEQEGNACEYGSLQQRVPLLGERGQHSVADCKQQIEPQPEVRRAKEPPQFGLDDGQLTGG